MVSFNEKAYHINCKFIGQPMEEIKECLVWYGPEISDGCNYMNLSWQSSASSKSSQSTDLVSIGLNHFMLNNTKNIICFTVKASSGGRSVYVEGKYHLNGMYSLTSHDAYIYM